MRIMHSMMRISIAIALTTLTLITQSQFAQAQSQSPLAQSRSTIGTLLRESNPVLDCTGSGEVVGEHPGWSTSAAIALNLVELTSTVYAAYWCPAAAPNGKGVISYTVTNTLNAITCVTVETFCTMSGVVDQTPISIMASDETGSYPIAGAAIQNDGLIKGCEAGNPDCSLPVALTSFPTYGNDPLSGVQCCTFAAVANWEQIALGIKPNVAKINAQFLNSGASKSGLTNAQLFNIWKVQGIGGVKLQSATRAAADPFSIQKLFNTSSTKALIAQLQFSKGQNFAGYQMTDSSYHWIAVAGYTQAGPVVISWGHKLQMTWQQWNLEAIAVWNIQAN